jgi:spore maturation protein CgeB
MISLFQLVFAQKVVAVAYLHAVVASSCIILPPNLDDNNFLPTPISCSKLQPSYAD